MYKEIGFQDLFPTTVWHTQLPTYQGFNQEWEKYIYGLRDKTPNDPRNPLQKLQQETYNNTIEMGLAGNSSNLLTKWYSPYLNRKDKPVDDFVNLVEIKF